MAETKGKRTIKSRPIDVSAGRTSYRQIIRTLNGTKISDSGKSEASYKFSGIQVTESEGHPFHSSKKKGKTDLGGPFWTQKVSPGVVKPIRVRTTLKANNLLYEYDILTYCLAVAPATGLYPPSSIPRFTAEHEMDVLGTKAIAQVAPTNPVVNMLTTLAEIRKEGLPSLPAIQSNWKDRTQTARNAGSEYLNVQFGWSPLLSEAESFLSNTVRVKSVIEQYKRDIGKVIRRTYHFPPVIEEKEELLSSTARPACIKATDLFNADWKLYRTTRTERRRWFSGGFTYYFPSEILGSKNLADFALLAERFGLKPTPEVLWNISPWSWAIDWFSNSGDVITNWTNFNQNGLVMRYGYMMEHSIVSTTYRLVGGSQPANMPRLPVSPVTLKYETKARWKANPYGFGVSWNGLDSFQVSILAALGISKSGR